MINIPQTENYAFYHSINIVNMYPLYNFNMWFVNNYNDLHRFSIIQRTKLTNLLNNLNTNNVNLDNTI